MNTPKPTAEDALRALDHVHNGVLIADEKRHASVALVRAYIESTRQPEPAGRLSPVVPEGWKLVPVEPTAAMLHAIQRNIGAEPSAYTAMLAAAPEPPK